MNIVFICGSLESGKDGVGDYVLRLSEELVCSGHAISIVAIFDKFIEEDEEGVYNTINGFIPYLRISHQTDYTKHFDKINLWIGNQNPDWISLQFVPFSYQNKGLPFKLGSMLEDIDGDFKWHIMFHEPWIQSSSNTSIKKKLMGFGQKMIIKKLIKQLSPHALNTSNCYYQKLLLNEGITTDILHLPSNIALSTVALEKMKIAFQELGINEEERNLWCILGVFGKIRENVDFIPLLKRMQNESISQNKKVAFFSIGKSGAYAQNMFTKLDQEFKGELFIRSFGEKSAEEVSAYLQLLDYGVSAVPNAFLGKSGAVSAMRLHQLKVLVPTSTIASDYDAETDEETQYHSNHFSALHIAEQFIQELNISKSKEGVRR